MSFGIALHVWGDYACFTRPELKAERMSYEVMTPSAARGILSAIYWKPEFEWVVERIHVLRPIRTTQIRRNEVGDKAVTPSAAVMRGEKADFRDFLIEEKRQQRSSTILVDVDYVIEAHVRLVTETPGVNNIAKHLEMFKRRASRGQCFYQPCMGVREFPAMFELVDAEHPMPESTLPLHQQNRALGLMLHDMVYTKGEKGKIICGHTKERLTATPHFFMAELKQGVLHVPPLHRTLT